MYELATLLTFFPHVAKLSLDGRRKGKERMEDEQDDDEHAQRHNADSWDWMRERGLGCFPRIFHVSQQIRFSYAKAIERTNVFSPLFSLFFLRETKKKLLMCFAAVSLQQRQSEAKTTLAPFDCLNISHTKTEERKQSVPPHYEGELRQWQVDSSSSYGSSWVVNRRSFCRMNERGIVSRWSRLKILCWRRRRRQKGFDLTPDFGCGVPSPSLPCSEKKS